MKFSWFFLSILIFLLPLEAKAISDFVSKKELQNSVYAFATEYSKQWIHSEKQRIEIVIDPIVNNIYLPVCTQKLELQAMHNRLAQGRLTVKIMCSMPQWSFYVGVQIHHYDEVVMSNQPILQNTLITKEMLKIQRMEITELTQGYFTEIAQITGSFAQHPLPINQIMTPYLLKIRPLIQAQEQVTIMANLGSIQIKTTGIALNSGQKGDLIRVRNLSSHKIVEGLIMDAGLIAVNH